MRKFIRLYDGNEVYRMYEHEIRNSQKIIIYTTTNLLDIAVKARMGVYLVEPTPVVIVNDKKNKREFKGDLVFSEKAVTSFYCGVTIHILNWEDKKE